MHARRATSDDLGGFARVIAAVAEERRWLLTEPPIDVAEYAARLRGLIEEGHRLFVLEHDGGIVGSLGLHPGAAAGVLTLGMAVLPEQRGRGGGRRLLEAALVEARDGASHKLELEVFPWNAAAISLYTAYGFEVEGIRRDHYRRSDGALWSTVLMALRLGA